MALFDNTSSQVANSSLLGYSNNTSQPASQMPSMSSLTSMTGTVNQLPNAVLGTTMTAPQLRSFTQNQQNSQAFDIKQQIQMSLQSDQGQQALKALADDFPQMQQYLTD